MRQEDAEKFTSDLMQDMGKKIKATFKPFDMGFALLVFPMGNPGIANYISTADRKDMITCLREAADRLEKKQDKPR